ncbi:MAG: DUF2177 family protein [Rhodothermales bacterium]|nr:DUF2177 family protein [Rhodothermales bacterium]MBO6778100.1 DUF2177 family protein [Rhodothermales bacterium]
MRIYVICLATFFAIDLLWLGVIAKGFYETQLGALRKDTVSWAPAIAFYLVYLAGLVHFVVTPAAGDTRRAALNGAAFGFVTYAAFDLTSLALIEGFGWTVALVDLLWGSLLGATVAWVGAKATRAED